MTDSLPKKGLMVGIIVLLIVAYAFSSGGSAVIKKYVPTDSETSSLLVNANGNIFYVGGNGTGNYTSIQGAIDAASDDDTIFVFNGTYYENLFLNKSVSLIGENKDSTIIDGNWCETVIRISSVIKNEVMIKGFTIRHGEEYGISSFGNLKVNIIGNNIMDNYGDGIYLDKVDRCNVSGNVIEKNSDGIYLYGSGTTNITNNIITDNYGGIHLYQSFNTKIIDNTVSDNHISGVLLTSCYDIVLEDNLIIYNYEGVYLYNCVVCNVSSNIISYSNHKGLTIASGYNNVVYNNTCSKNIMGITISDSEFNSIVYNTLKDNFGYEVKGLQFDGIGLYESCRLNQIYRNNLINDDIRFAEYTPYANSIRYNYYDGWMGAIPKPISGFKVVIISSALELPIRWIKFDWHPAKEPYDIL